MIAAALDNPRWIEEAVQRPDSRATEAALERQQQLTKPAGSLGRLEAVAVQLAGMQGCSKPQIERLNVTVFAADHGIAADGVSAYPQEVTAQMVANFASGGAAVTVLARHLGAEFEVVNLGTVAKVPVSEGVIDRMIAPATANFCQQQAMTTIQLQQALAVGAERIDRLAGQRPDLFIAGEMGIGNTSAATAIAAALMQRKALELTGPGTGLNRLQIQSKAQKIQQAIDLHAVAADRPLEALSRMGGFEIAAMVGAYLRCGQQAIPVLVDGFISSVAALVACLLQPDLRSWMLFGHQSAEPGHRLVLEALDAEPLLQLDMRLGEGSGAVLAVDLLRAACRLHAEMATFAEAGVSDRAE
ncbi:nicotinate-nucleotide--dimethylbenzimidazole phosphoribosyltransferase [Marinobacterium jannaschii]|uniref:nicotinate-nucleotide--dimethylbenzimidazole phosphoribosyltransferase n=1 Tax=Marinobacterium jannaschii TaxID=64970 RepID=UPI000A8F8756|nr:nicotinate-nucleotide--dimethylbenzimidazole phosphoribosyltransferase [Marinobacterium jannaschii]